MKYAKSSRAPQIAQVILYKKTGDINTATVVHLLQRIGADTQHPKKMSAHQHTERQCLCSHGNDFCNCLTRAQVQCECTY